MPPKRKRQEEAEFGSLWMHALTTTTPPRRKACLQCFEAKVRCDHKRPVCSRCTRRALRCDFSGAASEEPQPNPNLSPGPPFNLSTNITSTTTVPSTSAILQTADPTPDFSTLFTPQPHPHAPSSTTTPPEPQIHPSTNTGTDTETDPNLICPVDPSRVRDRWLNGWVPRPGQQPKSISRGTAVFIHSVLKSYPLALARSDVPPIVHGLQAGEGGRLPEALANCRSVARMWEGCESPSKMVRETTVREMERLFGEKDGYTQWELLAAFQAYVMYVTLLVVPEGEPVVEQSIMLNLQEFAHTLTHTGLVHPSESHPHDNRHRPPPWQTWALAEAKRRSLFAMYMLDDIVNTFSHVSCILGDELAGLPVPCSEKLWRADDEGKWRRAWDVHVGVWEGGSLRLGELWGRRAVEGEGEERVVVDGGKEEKERKREQRVQRWVGEMDGLGMVIFAVTTGSGC